MATSAAKARMYLKCTCSQCNSSIVSVDFDWIFLALYESIAPCHFGRCFSHRAEESAAPPEVESVGKGGCCGFLVEKHRGFN